MLKYSEAKFSNDVYRNNSCISAKLFQRFQFNKRLFNDCSKPQHWQQQRFVRRIDTKFYGKPKARADKLATKFHMDLYNNDQTISLVALVNKIAKEYLAKCPPVIYYDAFVEKSDGLILENLFKVKKSLSNQYQL